jgi:hypothetical protein
MLAASFVAQPRPRHRSVYSRARNDGLRRFHHRIRTVLPAARSPRRLAFVGAETRTSGHRYLRLAGLFCAVVCWCLGVVVIVSAHVS